MIDPQWLVRAANLTGASLEENDPVNLANELSEESEVLPWLLLFGDGFGDWAKTRAALKEVSQSILRPRSPNRAFSVRKNLAQREACKASILGAIKNNQEDDQKPIDEMFNQRIYLTGSQLPNDFIEHNT